MEIRKIQKTGGSTYLISLPKEWIKRLGLKQGNHLAIFEKKDGTLILDPRYDEKGQLKESIITPNGNIAIDITAKYLAGFDIIKIKSPNKITLELRELIKKTKERLIGIEIVEENANEITLNCLISPAVVPLNKTLMRIHLLALKMHEEAIKSLLEQDTELAENVIDRDEEVDRLYFLLVREIRTAIQDPKIADKMGITPLECLDLRIIIKNLENIADLATVIANKTLELRGQKIPDIMKEHIKRLSQEITKLHQDSIKALIKKEVSLAREAMSKKRVVKKELEKANEDLMEQPKRLAVHIDTVLDSIERITDYIIDIAEFVIRP